MAKALNFPLDPTLSPLAPYAAAVSQDQQWFNLAAGALEAYNAAHLANYALAVTRYGGSDLFTMAWPTGLAGGIYDVFVRNKAGGSPAEADETVWVAERVIWGGTGVSPGPVPPSAAGLVTGYLYCYDEAGVVEAGKNVYCAADSFLTGPAASANLFGLALDRAERVAISGADGLVSFVNLFKGVRYVVRRGTGLRRVVDIPADATDPYPLASVIGMP